LWGSRVVAVSNGTTPTMYFRFPNGSAIELQIGDSASHALEIRDNKCYANQKMVGEPCELSEVRSVSARRQRPEDLILSWLTFSSCVHVVGSANITLFKIDRDSLLQVKKGKLPFSTTYLIPDCTLPDYGPEYLVRDENSGVTKFLGNFPRNKSEENTAYQWCRPTQCLVVTVDWTQGVWAATCGGTVSKSASSNSSKVHTSTPAICTSYFHHDMLCWLYLVRSSRDHFLSYHGKAHGHKCISAYKVSPSFGRRRRQLACHHTTGGDDVRSGR
uniref:DUF5727 domain-containing protein n=1 Tax=Hydatigena taeniaeformis TaxID=6205 RepID=A0A0R3WTY5_HYDTA